MMVVTLVSVTALVSSMVIVLCPLKAQEWKPWDGLLFATNDITTELMPVVYISINRNAELTSSYSLNY